MSGIYSSSSSPTKQKRLHCGTKKAANDINNAVVWDYHVVLLLRSKGPSLVDSLDTQDVYEVQKNWVYDFDTRLAVPCSWTGARYKVSSVQCFLKCDPEYVSHTFFTDIPQQYQSLFRVVPGRVFLDYFASDRSHMLMPDTDGSRYISPPPGYGPVCGPKIREAGIANNLMSSFVSMITSGGTYGDVFEIDEFMLWLGSQSSLVVWGEA